MKQLNSPWTQTNAAIKIIQLGTTVLTGLIAGTVFGIWIGFNPENLSATAYVEQQQGTIGALNVLMPILGLLSIALTFCYAYSVRNNTRSLYMLTISILFLIFSALVTRFGNQPLNAIVITWSLDNIPDSWEQIRDQWWRFHVLRTISTLISFTLIACVGIIR